MPDVKVSVEIVNNKGLHARAAAKFVKLAETFQADVRVENNGHSVCGTSIMGLLLFLASKGTHITISASGIEAEEAIQALTQLIANKFDEVA